MIIICAALSARWSGEAENRVAQWFAEKPSISAQSSVIDPDESAIAQRACLTEVSEQNWLCFYRLQPKCVIDRVTKSRWRARMDDRPLVG